MTNLATPTLPAVAGSFSSRVWRDYFQHNSEARLELETGEPVTVDHRGQPALIASLQRFQIGESGEGAHLIAGADRTGDADYAQAIRLFIAEEQDHARRLAHVVTRLGGTLLASHWSDRVFVFLRRMMGLRTELMVLLIAELIARRYYRALYDGTDDADTRLMCRQIMHDELGHVRFHCDYLYHAFGATPGWSRTVIHFCWTAAFRATCLVVMFDHRRALRACNVPLESFWHDCGLLQSDASTRIFGNRAAARELLLGNA